MCAISRFTAADRDRVGQLWRALETGMEPPLWSSSWEWTSLWLDHFGDLAPHRFLPLEDADGTPRAVALLSDGRSRSRLRRIRTLHVGTAGPPRPADVYVECNRLVALPDARGELADAIARELADHGRFERLELNGFVASDAELFAERVPGLELTPEGSPYAELEVLAERGGGDLLEGFGRNTRQQLRRAVRELGDPVCDIAGGPDEALDIFDELVLLHQTRWQSAGEPGAFADGRVLAFHRELIRRRAPERAVLARVRVGERTVACLYSLVDGGVAYFYQGGIAEESNPKVRAGLVAHALCMRACLERGLTEYDFLAPATRYKEQLSTRARTLYWGSLRR
jgi:hypothetical protein